MRDDELRLTLRELAHAELDDDALRRAGATARQRVRSRQRLDRLRRHVDQLRDRGSRRLG